MICCCSHPEDWHGDRAIAACLDMGYIGRITTTAFGNIKVETYEYCLCPGFRPRQGRRSVWQGEITYAGHGVWSLMAVTRGSL